MTHPLTYPPAHDTALAELLDPISAAEVERLGLDLTNKRMMEVGAGGGSFTQWLLDRAGGHGFVFAVDRQPRLKLTHPLLVVLRNDLSTNDLPGYMNFIHARLTLAHIPYREDVLHRLVLSLAPGGTILIEDWYALDTRMVMAAPSDRDAELYNRFQETMGGLFEAGGTDRGWARRIHGQMQRLSLVNVQSRITAPIWSGGDWGCKLIQSCIDQAREPLLNSGVLTADELDRIAELLDNPAFVLAGHPLVSTSGARPV